MSGSIDSKEIYTFDEAYERLLGMDLNGVPGIAAGIKNVPPMEDLISLEGKTAIVTGGARGLGITIVNRLAEAGAKVVIVDLAVEFAEAAVAFFGTKGYQVKFFKADIRDLDRIQGAIDFAVKEFGSLDILVNNAGLWQIKHYCDFTEEDWDLCLDVCLKGTFFFTQKAAKQMVKQGTGGRVVNTISVGAYSMENYVGCMSPYVAAKGGILAMSRSLARELKPLGIAINCVCPPGMATVGGAHSGVPKDIMELMGTFPSVPVADPDKVARVVRMVVSDVGVLFQGSDIVADDGTRWQLRK
ncbi:MAG: SDR family oxidoreductase [Clostridiales bacterium]|jgi:2-deoxy-D-gluconate 3-dehydrogenase|nr:SDR family oxidoreductase [Clostridiales bacterium]